MGLNQDCFNCELITTCGDGVLEGNEECDGGLSCNTDCTIILEPVCNNGQI